MKANKYLLMLFFLFPMYVCAQQQITGKVTDVRGEPIPGVGVSAMTDGQRFNAVTTSTGDYSIKVANNTKQLTFSYIGMTSQTETINGRTVVNVQLSEESRELQSVVVTALGIKREAKALSYSRQSMDVSTLTQAPTTNIVSSLSGRIAGVQVTPASSNTGSARIIIRGNNSITGNNQPLFVIDGIPVDNETGDTKVTTSGNNNLDYGNIAGNINPEDIENIEVLKGPNAAALYGSRAANGAILITTKKSAGTKFKVTFNSNSTFQRITEFPDYQNMFGAGNSFKLDGSGSTSNPDRIPSLNVFNRSWGAPFLGQPVISVNGSPKAYLAQPDNVRDFYSTAAMLTNSLAIDGGNAENNYRFSYTNYTGGSVVKNINDNIRHNANIRVLNKFTKWLDMDSKVTFINNKVTNRQYMNGSSKNPVYQYAYMVRDDQLSEFKNYKDQYGNEINTHTDFLNPYWAINENPNEDTKNQLLGAFNVNARINGWLRLTAKVGTEMYWVDGYTFNNKGAQSSPNGSMSTINNSLQSTNADLVLFANNKFGKLSVNSFVGTGRFQTSNKKNEQRINSLIQAGLINLSNTGEFPAVTQFASKKIINSVYGSMSFGYNSYLFMDVTARNDWSSTLPKANNSYFYPSIGGSFVFTDAFKDIPKSILSFGKVRASYAIVGNDTSPYQLAPTYSFNGIYNGQAYAALASTFFNPDLKPEKTASLEFGIDLRFLKDRLTFGATHYKTSTTNQILTAQITPTSGYNRKYYNAGEIQNWGTEFTLSGTPLKSKKLEWNMFANYGQNNSKVKSLVDGVNSFQLNSWFGRLLVFAEVDQPYSVIRGAGWQRDEQGRKLVAASGLPIAQGNLVLGNAMPDWTGGFGNSLRYQNFGLSFLIDIRKGGSFYSGTYRRSYISGAISNTLEGREDYYLHSYIYGESAANLTAGFIYKDAYFEDGTPNNKYITPQSNGFSNLDELQIFDASFVKLRETVISYNLTSPFFKKLKVSNARISLSGRNLWTIYKKAPKGIDPESSVTSGNGQGIEYGSLPPFTTYGLDLRLTF
ncbi:SusC/RagA family TonB-linked outer membrane protein [Pedobacter heparinus]|uniref:TonB-dependent receptor plug n=1 Tax=Pedobacter heparinus (strain ATCC 13125 / DSM 2366 / CIP 104194 / JCM 7457 / NBRC 12017 / NCIMB 9290 / NRRL B-14731 / HIM 762-3) TaxID=485917 RepID=C6XSJ4_PEDHD|nr:SusC/RagA family TonB-linked outer membrane protein [Pedobacter heparinus]ACU05557.1 TonB-dependent receptor plug [Pedobacter heparinus DSM 2366]